MATMIRRTGKTHLAGKGSGRTPCGQTGGVPLATFRTLLPEAKCGICRSLSGHIFPTKGAMPKAKAHTTPRFGTADFNREMRERDRMVEAAERREGDGFGLAPWDKGDC